MYLKGLRMKLNDLGSAMTDKDVVIHILNDLMKDYEDQLSKLKGNLRSTINPLIIDDVTAELQLKYTKMKTKNTIQIKDEYSEKGLVAASKYKGTFTFCSKIGHMAMDLLLKKGKKEKKA